MPARSTFGYFLCVRAAPVLRLVKNAEEPQAPAREPTDEEIIDAVQRHDERVSGLLYDRVSRVVDRTLYRIFGRYEDDHEDLVQAVFEQIVITITKRRFARACSLSTWAATVASHVGLNALRSRRRERNVIDRKTEAPESVRVADADTRADLRKLRDALASIDPIKAETVVLHDVLGHELAEIAVMMDTTVAAAQSRLVRGRRELADAMEGR